MYREGGEPIVTIKVGADRRAPAPHPGPVIREEYFEPLGLSAAAVAVKAGMDPRRFGEMIAGKRSFDVEHAVRLGRALQLPADKIMQMQLKHDFSEARRTVDLQAIPPLEAQSTSAFPEAGFLRGRLGRLRDDGPAEVSAYFQQDIERREGDDDYAGVHALWRGDLLRIYDPHGSGVLWSGPILQSLDGRMLLPYARSEDWRSWFADAHRADLAFGAQHIAFLQRMHAF